MPDDPAAGVSSDVLTDALQRYFGFARFRLGQEGIVRRAVDGLDTLALMPTGAGKSLCYQLAAMLRPQPTLVLSPLIALMKDQIDNLPSEIAARACLINSSLSPGEVTQRLAETASGRYNLVYAAPERLRQRNFISALRSVGLGLVVIDEVHCVSMWGHDFRPDYMFIRTALESLDNPVVLGMTATATRATERDIAQSLGRTFDVVRTPVVRANLRYEVEHVDTMDDRLRSAVAHAQQMTGSGIIYARSRKNCEQIARVLRSARVGALHYHAGLIADERKRVQESFLRGQTRVIVATTAFGMGIDKADIRWVLLYDYPSSLEDYVQRIGRAGRDGETSVCTLLSGPSDGSSLLRFARGDTPTVDDLRAVYRELRARVSDGVAEVDNEELTRAAGLPESTDSRVLVGMLERAGLVQRDFDLGRGMRILVLPPPTDAPARIDGLLRQYAAGAEARAQRMITFAEMRQCRHMQVAEHFGETVKVPCGMCDVCSPRASAQPASRPEPSPLPADIAGCIVDMVATLPFPLTKTGLGKALKGSVDAAPTAQRNPGYGSLASVPLSVIVRWIEALLAGNHLVQYPSPDGSGFSLLKLGDRDTLPLLHWTGSTAARGNRKRGTASRQARPVSQDPELSMAEGELFERLRAWRRATASEKKISPFIVMKDRVLLEIVGRHPATKGELERIEGLHSTKIEQYGDDILAILTSDSA